LVVWLNGLPEVAALLEREFHGKAIREQNLSEWKRGGFLDWQRHQEAMASLRVAAEEAEELRAEGADDAPLTDVLSASIASVLARLIGEMRKGGGEDAESRRELLTLIREWAALRQGDHRAARLKLRRETWQRQCARDEAEAAKAAALAEQEKPDLLRKKLERIEYGVIRESTARMERNLLIHSLVRGRPAAEAQQIRDLLEKEIRERQAALVGMEAVRC
ncbi:MAG: hypothetical protein JWO89_1575, partial [Verrucomicrobiaceae bacterium]|nr:hypothetical protein [Verrucomicrobiaceae bacterium]